MNPPSRLLVAGPAPDAALAALFLKRSAPGLEIRLLQTPGDLDPAGEPATPLVIEQFTGALGIPAAEIHRQLRPVWTLGFSMDWGRGRSRLIRPYDAAPAHREPAAHTWDGFLAAASDGGPTSLGSALIEAGKVFPKSGRKVRLMEQMTGLQLLPGRLGEFLRAQCLRNGIKVLDGTIDSLETSDDTLTAIRMADGKRHEADWFVDATGSEARLIGAVGGSGFDTAGTEGLCNRAWTVTRHRGSEAIRPFTTIDTLDIGWRWRVEHDVSIGFGLAFHSDFTDDAQAREALLEKVRDPATEPRLHHWPHGQRQNSWSGNVVAVGDAAAFVEPLAATRLPLLILHLHSLAQIFREIHAPGPQSRLLYQRMLSDAWRELRDFTNLFHGHNHVSDSPFWRHSRQHAEPGGHRRLLDLFAEGGPHPILENAMPFAPCTLGFSTWLAALVSLDVPFRHRPDPAPADLESWRARVAGWRQTAAGAATVESCLRTLRR